MPILFCPRCNGATYGDFNSCVCEPEQTPQCPYGPVGEAIERITRRMEYCRRMEGICNRSGEPSVAKNWSIRVSECRKSLAVLNSIQKN